MLNRIIFGSLQVISDALNDFFFEYYKDNEGHWGKSITLHGCVTLIISVFSLMIAVKWFLL